MFLEYIANAICFVAVSEESDVLYVPALSLPRAVSGC